MAEVDTSSGGGHKKGPGVKKGKKLSTRVDLTPMVDLGFLLITFFVFTTTMSQPTAMNMNEPKDNTDKQMEVKESATLTFLLGNANTVYYYHGILDPNKVSDQFKSTTFKEVRQLIVDKKRKTDPKDLMFIIKADSTAKFKNAINILDEMSISDIPAGHYAEVDISPIERMLIRKTEEANNIK